MSLTKKRTTRLEVAVENGDDISALLDAKLAHYQKNNMPVEEGIADYIALGIDGQKDKIAQYEQYKKDLDAAIKELKSLEKETETKVYSWMEANGIEKLKGRYCSSITIKKASTSITNKTVRDITDSELLEKGLAHQVETIKDIPASIKINNRKSA